MPGHPDRQQELAINKKSPLGQTTRSKSMPRADDPLASIDRRALLTGGASAVALSLLPAGAMASKNAIAADACGYPQRQLLKADLSRLLDYKCRAKRVLARRAIETDRPGWYASEAVSLEIADDTSKSGRQSLRFRTLLRNEAYVNGARSANGTFTGDGVLFAGIPFSAFIARKLEPAQDWSAFNRISLWCYVHPTANPVNSFSIRVSMRWRACRTRRSHRRALFRRPCAGRVESSRMGNSGNQA